MSDIRAWSKTAASNTDASNGGMPEGQAPSSVNDNVRTQIAAHRTQWEDAEWFDWGHVPAQQSATTFTVSNSVTTVYAIGRRLKLYDATTLYGHVISISAVSGTNTKFTVSLASGNLTASLTSVAVSILDPTNTSLPKGAVLDTPTITAPTINTSVAGTAVATQAQMETGTAVNVIVTPGRMQNHPAFPKAICVFNANTNSEIYTYNCSYTRNGTGDHTVTFVTDFSNTSYGALISHSSTLAGSQGWDLVSQAAGAFRFRTYYESPADNSQVVNPDLVTAVFYGDQ